MADPGFFKSGTDPVIFSVSKPSDPNIWYFAYGSNMSKEKFTGSRGIRPLSAARVTLPGWKMTMGVPGMPYSEPAFSVIEQKDSTKKVDTYTPDVTGVAYLITPEQYIKVKASEGGGIAYSDISVEARPVTCEDESLTGPRPTIRTLGAILTKSPAAKPSERYMNLLKVGALEWHLPSRYRHYIGSLPTYTPSKHWRRRIGSAIFLAIWGPVMSLMEKLTNGTLQADGHVPDFVAWVVRSVVYTIWIFHDYVFAPIFGRGDGMDEDDWGDEKFELGGRFLPNAAESHVSYVYA
ncbi:hypothetical protein MMC11_004275 [Xylographa trunciseda]|nr:hypothetical protein [Xylographa trunciseda]